MVKLVHENAIKISVSVQIYNFFLSFDHDSQLAFELASQMAHGLNPYYLSAYYLSAIFRGGVYKELIDAHGSDTINRLFMDPLMALLVGRC